MEKIDSGIEGFDKLLYGGIPKGRAYLVSGEPGTGKTIFSLQYLLHGISLGEKCVYISIDEKPEHVIMDAEALGWNITPFLESGALQIIDVTQYFATSDTKGSGIDVNKVIDLILSYVKNNGVSRLAIDPVAPLIFSDADFPNVVEYIRKLIFSVENNTGCTTLMTSYVPVGSEKVSSVGIEEFACSGIITLKLVKLNNKRIRTIGIRKMRGTRIDLTEYSFEILPDRGVVLRQPI
ncbi:recombinase RecA [Candidatus Marinamargulisbacteria bacterium SCGC AAA071-K20]|nr:recombinase RecA [Candidatus Marinamargulisbacteria bacterium SCGC AAA071-K20]